MYVIQVSGSGAAAAAGKAANEVVLVPAERCTWTVSSDTNGGYSVSNVAVFSGNAANPSDLGNTNLTFEFGYISKTGRFVRLT